MTSIAKAAAVLVGTIVYLGLAVILRGGPAVYFAIPALTALAIATVVFAFVSLFVGGNLSPGIREDRGNRWVLPIFGLIGLLDAILPPMADRAGLWSLDGTATRWVGIVLFVAGMVLRLWPVYVLGNRFSGLVAIQPGHTLATTGVYAAIRNPSYLGLLTATLGLGLAFNTWVGVLLAVALVPPLIARMNAEERLLRDQFGAEYEAYRARTCRLIPWVY
jgi:protein-S-isoprenylcysteine O-methyltransferase Ste14